ncbi:MAG: putative transporter permease component [Microbacterium sp.]|jgi:ABC-type nitrate/sulfonate/bicarbonate transport system permease component|nr:putative transporter permease component [Microbacterium sp.]
MKDTIAWLIGVRIFFLLCAAAIAVVAWIIVLGIYDVVPLIGKRPWDVFAWLFTADEAAENRAVIASNLVVTIRDASVGYLVGLTFAFVLGVVFVLSSTLEQIVTPAIMLARSIPLLVMTPLITLVFGLNLVGVSAVVTAVVFFPALVNIVFGLRAVNPQHVELVRAHSGTTWDLMWKVSVPTALPALFASARLAVPLAVTGAMIAEWLATGEGLGGSIARSSGTFDFNQLWASAVVIALFTMCAYTVVSVAEALVTRRFGAIGE